MGQSDEELARAAVWPLFGDRATDAELRRRIALACAAARAQGRADALTGRGEASTAEGPTTAAIRPKPSSEALERVASALWRQWWRLHGEHEPSFHFSQLYESARQRWIDIAAAGIEARDEGSAT